MTKEEMEDMKFKKIKQPAIIIGVFLKLFNLHVLVSVFTRFGRRGCHFGTNSCWYVHVHALLDLISGNLRTADFTVFFPAMSIDFC